MKRLFKKLAGLMMGLLAVAGLAGLGANSEAPVKAEAATIVDGTKFYLTPGPWNVDGARFAAYFCNGEDASYWYSMTDTNGDGVYEAVAKGSHKNVIFVRMKGSNTTNDWSNMWNQTDDLVWDGTKNHWTVTGWNKSDGKWSVYNETPDDTIHAGDKVYLLPNSNWEVDNAWFAVEFAGGSSSNVSVKMVDSDGDGIFEATATQSNAYVNFLRMDPQLTEYTGSSWNKVSGGTFDSSKPLMTITDWESGSWGEYVEPTKYTLTIKEGDKVLDTDTYLADKEIYPELFEKEGFRLEGYYTDSALTVPFVKGTKITADTTIYAKYIESADYTIYFKNTLSWTNIHVHIWSENSTSGTEWPGLAMTAIDGTDFFYFDIDAEKSYDSIVVNNNNNKIQTENIDIKNANDGDVIVLGEMTKDGGTTEATKYDGSIVSSKKVFAHIAGETIPAYNGLGDTGLTAESNGVSVVKLSKTGFTFDAEATAALTDEEKKNVVIDYIDNLSTCDVFQNCELYEQLVDSIDPNLKSEIISETYDNKTNNITIGEKLEYMETYKAWEDAHPNDNNLGSNLLTNLTSSNNTLIVLIVGLLGLTAVGAYYFLNKKKYAK